jgi:hypothetical protein
VTLSDASDGYEKVLNTTVDLIRAALRADQTLTPAERTQTLALVRNGRKPAEANNHFSPTLSRPSLIRPARAAERLACTPRQIHRLASEGLLEKVKFPGRQRASGITEASLEKLLNASTVAGK